MSPNREVEHHREPAAGRVRRLEGPAQRLGQAAGHRQAETDAGADVALPLERLEDPSPVSAGATPGPWSTTRSPTRLPCAVADDRDDLAVAQGVRDQVGDDALEQPGVDVRRGELVDVDTLGALEADQRAAYDLTERDVVGDRATAPVSSRLMSSRSLTIVVSRAIDDSMASSSSWRSASSSRWSWVAGSRSPSAVRPAAYAGRARRRRGARSGCGCRPRAAGRPWTAAPAPRARAAPRRAWRTPRPPTVRAGPARHPRAPASRRPRPGRPRRSRRRSAPRSTSSGGPRAERVTRQVEQPRDVVRPAEDLAVEHRRGPGLALGRAGMPRDGGPPRPPPTPPPPR